MVRRFMWVIVTLGAVPLLGLGAVYGASELRLRSYDEPPAFHATIPSDSASLARGRHLARVAGYSREAFETLMRTGVPIDGRDLGLMAMVARDRFAAFTEQDVDDLYAFLTTLAARS